MTEITAYSLYSVQQKQRTKINPLQVIEGITKMFPEQEKIELFARNNYDGWDNWGLEIPDSKIQIQTGITKVE